jgi:hypothetical protein
MHLAISISNDDVDEGEEGGEDVEDKAAPR